MILIKTMITDAWQWIMRISDAYENIQSDDNMYNGKLKKWQQEYR